MQFLCLIRLELSLQVTKATMRFSELVDVSARVGATGSRHEKIDLLREWLRRLAPTEIAAGVHYLSGRLPQGRIGIGGELLRAAHAAPIVSSAPSLEDVDRLFAQLARTSGKGSNTIRREHLREMFARASDAEREFLVRLIAGELRQGALEGVMLEAVAKAAEIPADEVRRATMVAGDLGGVAQAALVEGSAGLKRFGLQLFQPIRPMLAQPADSVEEALAEMGEAGLSSTSSTARAYRRTRRAVKCGSTAVG